MANLGTESPQSLPPSSSLPESERPILSEEEDRMRRFNLKLRLMSEREEFLDMSISDPEERMMALRRKLEKNVESWKKPRTCEVCLKPQHPGHARCPLMRSAKEDSVVGPGWMIICACCAKENAHPGKKGVRRHATRRYCGNCNVWGDHCSATCTNPTNRFKLSRSYIGFDSP